MESDSSEKKAFSLALRRLASRETSTLEMKEYLKKKGFSREDIETTVERLLEDKLIDDQRYARAMTRAVAAKGKGPMQVVAALRKKGVELSLRQAKALLQDEVSEWDEVALARKTVERRYPDARTDPKAYRRAYQALLRRGFSPEVIKKSLGSDPDDEEGV